MKLIDKLIRVALLPVRELDQALGRTAARHAAEEVLRAHARRALLTELDRVEVVDQLGRSA
ncbi:MAG: hypothetical protein M3345_05470 [Actinomycetota bacterium]|nr:hypothetical protein [Actinomycetota bacterium]